ncbi:MAG: hypothetical protein MJ236_02685 [Clostridia bacterium]|nr:hypothetical protein [Clostridia bacterium]
MEGYKTFKEAVADASTKASLWKFLGNGAEFDKEELLKMAEFYDSVTKPDGWNYYGVFNEGAIALVTMPVNEVEPLFIPIK